LLFIFTIYYRNTKISNTLIYKIVEFATELIKIKKNN
jgi:hypothetical protein